MFRLLGNRLLSQAATGAVPPPLTHTVPVQVVTPSPSLPALVDAVIPRAVKCVQKRVTVAKKKVVDQRKELLRRAQDAGHQTKLIAMGLEDMTCRLKMIYYKIHTASVLSQKHQYQHNRSIYRKDRAIKKKELELRAKRAEIRHTIQQYKKKRSGESRGHERPLTPEEVEAERRVLEGLSNS